MTEITHFPKTMGAIKSLGLENLLFIQDGKLAFIIYDKEGKAKTFVPEYITMPFDEVFNIGHAYSTIKFNPAFKGEMEAFRKAYLEKEKKKKLEKLKKKNNHSDNAIENSSRIHDALEEIENHLINKQIKHLIKRVKSAISVYANEANITQEELKVIPYALYKKMPSLVPMWHQHMKYLMSLPKDQRMIVFSMVVFVRSVKQSEYIFFEEGCKGEDTPYLLKNDVLMAITPEFVNETIPEFYNFCKDKSPETIAKFLCLMHSEYDFIAFNPCSFEGSVVFKQINFIFKMANDLKSLNRALHIFNEMSLLLDMQRKSMLEQIKIMEGLYNNLRNNRIKTMKKLYSFLSVFGVEVSDVYTPAYTFLFTQVDQKTIERMRKLNAKIKLISIYAFIHQRSYKKTIEMYKKIYHEVSIGKYEELGLKKIEDNDFNFMEDLNPFMKKLIKN